MKNITAGIIGAMVAIAVMGAVGVIQHYRSAYQQTGPGGDPFRMEQLSSTENARYAAMSAEGAARAFFQGCGRGDGEEAAKFCAGITPFNEKFKEWLMGVTVVSLGKPFTRPGFAATFVPREIRFKSGETKKFNLAIRREAPSWAEFHLPPKLRKASILKRREQVAATLFISGELGLGNWLVPLSPTLRFCDAS